MPPRRKLCSWDIGLHMRRLASLSDGAFGHASQYEGRDTTSAKSRRKLCPLQRGVVHDASMFDAVKSANGHGFATCACFACLFHWLDSGTIAGLSREHRVCALEASCTCKCACSICAGAASGLLMPWPGSFVATLPYLFLCQGHDLHACFRFCFNSLFVPLLLHEFAPCSGVCVIF